MAAFIALSAAIIIGAVPACSEPASAQPFFMFSAYRFASAVEGEAVRGVLGKYFTGQDYLGRELVKTDEKLAALVGHAHTISLPASIEQILKQADSKEAGLVIYDIEHWASTPEDEQKDPLAAVDRAAGLIHASGSQIFGIAPDGEYLGLRKEACEVSLDKCIIRQVDIKKLDMVIIQAQRLLSDRCAKEGGPEKYVLLVTTLAKEMKAKNPQILVVAQVSFRYTPPERMIEALRRVQGCVDGFYFAYPPPRDSVYGYCSAGRLKQVLEALRSLAPKP